ncbi:hypothetical protein GIW06_23105 [Pseudomonas syringae]|uniref:Uncharacterized protein n=1 Tax=Pseudomonas syringae UB303 TaxID=1357287 RepID=A0AAJ4E3E8_PSESX|nr:hypothetical protein [Pseudomonas syringae]QHF07457.1 hypothetical protein N026_08165 [Pseudomonas syringae UB303]MCF5032071.1 hypothetical protein [Pseudomonas syringae]MCF5180442.1 hypothetical protein [Pseudomonas syringae]MCF5198055.1 hypothetical protein [Pseudomonas syringae]
MSRVPGRANVPFFGATVPRFVAFLLTEMPFVTLCVTRRFCDISWIEVRLRFSFPRSAW